MHLVHQLAGCLLVHQASRKLSKGLVPERTDSQLPRFGFRSWGSWLSVHWCTRPFESLQLSHGADAEQTLSSRPHWHRELSVLLAQSAIPATLSPAPCASRWPNRGRSGVMATLLPETKALLRKDLGPLQLLTLLSSLSTSRTPLCSPIVAITVQNGNSNRSAWEQAGGPAPRPQFLVTFCGAICSHLPWLDATRSPAPPSHHSPALIGAHQGQQHLHCCPLLALCHRCPPCSAPPPGVSSCASLQVAQDQTREGQTCITTICPQSRTEISLLTCKHKELFDIEIGSQKNLHATLRTEPKTLACALTWSPTSDLSVQGHAQKLSHTGRAGYWVFFYRTAGEWK
ncbi:hypothetical protein QTO34_019337 [Cnephaeus nilssonii]|uniref:Uncharacterized protein n=1 Tax=Cnephaeus nilssonii TaxID=3371016 RepID=A0AA40HWJ7_CNENI|nr:hypothetical protein QTO34_019337 [Eptesicus nilssonii]